MNGKSKISPGNTYILDEDELDQLDDLSLTSVISEAAFSVASEQQPCDDDQEAPLVHIGEDEPTIDDLLADTVSLHIAEPVDRQEMNREDTGAFELDVLISHETLFPEEPEESDDE